MPLLTADPVTVLPGQREALEQLVRTHSTPQQVALRARIILHAVEGMGVRESARELGVWPKTARYWRKRWRDADDKRAVCERLADATSPAPLIAVVDELEEQVALRRVALESVCRNDRAEVLDRHRDVHELPGDALALRIEQVMLELCKLGMAQHGAGRVERGGEELRRVDRRGLGQLGVAERAVVDHEDRRIGPIGVVAIEIGLSVEPRIAGAAIGLVLDGVVLLERRGAVAIKCLIVDEGAGAGESRIGAGRRSSGKVAGDVAIVDDRQDRRCRLQRRPAVDAKMAAVDLVIFGLELLQRAGRPTGR